jgi:hypothetical protein
MSGILLAYPTLHLSVEGHTDSVGSDEYNMKLSERRADSLRDYLTSNGINAANIQAVGMGKANPVASNDTGAGRQQNRRVEMVVSGDVIGQPITNGTTSNIQPPAPYQAPDNGTGGISARFRPEAGKMSPAPSGLQEVDGLNHLLEVLVLVDTLFGNVTDSVPKTVSSGAGTRQSVGPNVFQPLHQSAARRPRR